MIAHVWPEALLTYLSQNTAQLHHVVPLTGLSQNQVWRVTGTPDDFIVKRSSNSRELDFYRAVAPRLKQTGVATPVLFWGDTIRATTWIIIEAIPMVLPAERWCGDPDVMALLKRLHEAPLDLPEFTPFQLAWTDEMTTAAIAAVPPGYRQRAAQQLDRLQGRCQPLFTAQHWLSGDPNPRNWGIRADGQLVLFDWERFGSGSPALDLAITIPGLGTRSQYRQVAQQYLAHSSPTSRQIAELARSIQTAKAWNIAEFIWLLATGQTKMGDPEQQMMQLGPKFAAWLDELEE